MSSFTRGPLPARVYWTRRLLAIAVAVLLVVGIAQLLRAGSDGATTAVDRGTPVAAAPTGSPSASGTPQSGATSGQPTTKDRKKQGPGKARTSRAPVLAEPRGRCFEEDLAVSPEATRAVAGPQGEIRIALHLRTLTSPACTWHVSARTLTLKVTSGSDDIWSSRQCPGAVPRRDVVVRRAVTTTVELAWNGRRADRGCGVRSDWALPGTYHVTAAALAGEPADEQFELEAPRPRVITLPPSPTQEPKKGERGKQGAGGAPEPSPTSSD